MRKLYNLQPKRVFYYFEELCGIPHGSGNTAAISQYCVSFAQAHNLSYIQDEIGNVVICKPASAGYEDHEPVVLQGHLDMVCEKAPDCSIDFERDGLDLAVDGDWLYAIGTALGGDDGIAVAMILAILEADSLPHPPIEALFTVDEEIGLLGAAALDGSTLTGRRLINIDSEDEGVLTVSCAGGIHADITLPIDMKENSLPCYTVAVRGLLGGHSGVEIDKGRLNANVLLASFLATLPGIRLVSISGGLKDNAIPPMSDCVVASALDITAMATAFAQAYRVESDPDLSLIVNPVETASHAMTVESTHRVLSFLTAAPNGIMSMSEDIDGLVQTSLNLGVLVTENATVRAGYALRSSVGMEKMALVEGLTAMALEHGGSCVTQGDYPAWEYRKESVLRDTMCRVWQQMVGEQPQVMAIHAGLECGYLCEKMNGLDAVSIGPNMQAIHTCHERLSISSVARIYRYVCKVLEAL